MVIELKIEEFKPEFAGKMSFYLSAIDDLLRHESDAPTIGIILCQGKNEVIVEYALRDSSKPLGVAEYRLSAALPGALQRELPTIAEFASELPFISLVKLRIDVERELRSMLADHDLSERPTSLMMILDELQRAGLAPHTTDAFREALPVLNRAAHGVELDADDTRAASEVAISFLAELRRRKG